MTDQIRTPQPGADEPAPPTEPTEPPLETADITEAEPEDDPSVGHEPVVKE